MKKIFALLLAVIMVLSLAACGGGADKGSTLVYGSGDYDSINPIMNEHCEIKHLLFDSLVKLDKDGKPVASLAESWTYDDATLTYTFKLRSDVKWHDGEKFTADDVKFTIEAIMNPDNGSENYPNYIEIKEIKVISDTEITFILSEPNYAFLDYMTMSILPEHKLQGEDMWESAYFKNPIGTGPYKVVALEPSVQLDLVRFEDYVPVPEGHTGSAAPKLAYMDSISIMAPAESNTIAMGLASGKVDMAEAVTEDLRAQVYAAGVTSFIKPFNTSITVNFNAIGKSKNQSEPQAKLPEPEEHITKPIGTFIGPAIYMIGLLITLVSIVALFYVFFQYRTKEPLYLWMSFTSICVGLLIQCAGAVTSNTADQLFATQKMLTELMRLNKKLDE